MRKLILTGILIIVLFFGSLAITTGMTFPTKIYSLSELKAKKAVTNTQLDALTTLKSTTYANSQKTLDDSIKNFKSIKELYEATMNNKTEIEKERAIGGVSYDLSYLWVKLGKYATDNHCDLTIEVFQNQETSPDENYTLCDFKFYITASYLDLLEFVEKISLDPELNFIPENIKMYSEYMEVKMNQENDETTNPEKNQEEEEEKKNNETMLVVKTEFYKTNIPVNKLSLSKVENLLTLESERVTNVYTTEEKEDSNNTNSTDNTNTTNSNNTKNTNNTNNNIN